MSFVPGPYRVPLLLGLAAASIGGLTYAARQRRKGTKQLEYKNSEEKRVLDDFPVVDLNKYLNKQAGWEEECKKASDLLNKYGCFVVQDPRVSEKDNSTFIDMMERYYDQPRDVKLKDIRPEVYYQVGSTPDLVEQARNDCSKVDKMKDEEKPLTLCPPEADPKWRFFWRMGERPPQTSFESLNSAPVIPYAFPEWAKVMDSWGNLMLGAISTLSEMTAIGFGLSSDTFTKLMKYGPHLLAPTGGDLGHEKYGKLGTVFANYHYDLNFLTIHGRSRFPGLFIWTREGKRYPVKVPPGCLLVQAGKQFEWLTGGYVLAGFHEVIVSKDTIVAADKAREEKRSLWRVSSTLFSHIASDNILEPLGIFSTEESRKKYPPTKTGDQVQQELAMIKLGIHTPPKDGQ